MPGKSIFTIIIETNRYCKKAEQEALLGRFLIIIGMMSKIPATTPISNESNVVFMFICIRVFIFYIAASHYCGATLF